MSKVVFKSSPKSLIVITMLVAGLLVFVWLHWRGERQTELIIFSVLAVLATTLYTIRAELSLSVTSRELCGVRLWLGLPIRKTVVRVGSGDALYLTEEIVRQKQGIAVYYQLKASGQLLSQGDNTQGPFVLASQMWTSNRAKLVDFAEEASQTLGIALEDSRTFTEQVEKLRRRAA
jgi:hypothetical protein